MINIFFISNIISILFIIYCLLFFTYKNKIVSGVYLGIAGILIAIIFSLLKIGTYLLFFCSTFVLLISGIIGLLISNIINIINVPELIAFLHSFIGFSSIFLSINSIYLLSSVGVFINKIYLFEILLNNIFGTITFICSLISYLRLTNSSYIFLLNISNKYIIYINLLILCFLSLFFLNFTVFKVLFFLFFLIFISSFLLSVSLISNISSSDIPIFISMLNSFSGWTTSATGFILDSNLLIVIGAIIGSAGLFLSQEMCRVMNKSIFKVILNNFLYNKYANRKVRKNLNYSSKYIDIYSLYKKITFAKSIIIVPGYGMAVSQSHYVINDIFQCLKNKYFIKNIKFAIHPIAGRLPGHMNILLAESGINYKYFYTLGKINKYFNKSDMVLVVGASDIINPRANYDKNCVLYGMPILEVFKSKCLIILKKNDVKIHTNYSGIDNPILYNKNTRILIGDAKINLIKLFNLINVK